MKLGPDVPILGQKKQAPKAAARRRRSAEQRSAATRLRHGKWRPIAVPTISTIRGDAELERPGSVWLCAEFAVPVAAGVHSAAAAATDAAIWDDAVPDAAIRNDAAVREDAVPDALRYATDRDDAAATTDDAAARSAHRLARSADRRLACAKRGPESADRAGRP